MPAGWVGDYVNAFERLRDPSHFAPGPWRNGARHFISRPAIEHEEQIYKPMEFKSWAPATTPSCRRCCARCWRSSTPEVKAALEPKGDGNDLTFRLCEGLLVAKRA